MAHKGQPDIHHNDTVAALICYPSSESSQPFSCCDKHQDQRQLEEKSICLAYTSRSQSITAGKSRQELKQNWNETQTGLVFGPCSVAFLIWSTPAYLPRDGATTVGWALTHQSMTFPSSRDTDQFFNNGSSSSSNSRLCQVNNKSQHNCKAWWCTPLVLALMGWADCWEFEATLVYKMSSRTRAAEATQRNFAEQTNKH